MGGRTLKLKNRLEAVIIAAVMLLGAIPTVGAVAAAEGLPFRDVEIGEWYYDAVCGVWEAGIMTGVEDDRFDPSSPLTRAQIVTIFYRLSGTSERGLGKKLPFTDTSKKAWYADYLGWALTEGLVSGYPEGDFRPNAPVSRQELAKLIVLFLRYIVAQNSGEPLVDSFNDADTFPSWSADYIERLRETGLMAGDQSGNFLPNNGATRAEIATVIMRMKPLVDEALKILPPTMGWSSWNCLGVSVNEESIIAQMDRIIELGLDKLGYSYVNIDDGWMNGRDSVTGRVNVDTEKFPHGMKYIADEAHRRGLKVGIYTDAGKNTCGGGNEGWGWGVGLYGHAEDDLWRYLGEGTYIDTYAAGGGDDGVECWGFDYIKVDFCGGQSQAGDPAREDDLDPEKTYGGYDKIIHEIERETGKNKVFNVCSWFYRGPWQLRTGDSWRSGVDVFASWGSVSGVIDKQKRVGVYTIPGHYGDTDMLQVGNGSLTAAENRTHFAMWAMFASPLVIGCDLRYVSDENVALMSNTELIAINQDPVGRSAAYVKTLGSSTELWMKEMSAGNGSAAALALYNSGEEEETVTLDLSDICAAGKAVLRDAITHTDIGECGEYRVTVAPHDTEVLTLTCDGALTDGAYDLVRGDVDYDIDIYEEFDIDIERDKIDAETAHRYMRNAAAFNTVMIDVRSAEEYEEGHLDGAVNVNYRDLVTSTDKVPQNQEAVIIVYCSAGKRSTQAYLELKRMRYKNVYILSDMNAY